MNSFICVYDFETDGTNPETCEPVQLASCMLNPATLEIVKDSEFHSFMKPELKQIYDEISSDDPTPSLREEKWEEYYQRVKDTIFWHAKNQNPDFYSLSDDNKDKFARTILDKWKKAPEQKNVWKNFSEYLLKYNTNQSSRTKYYAPIRAGANIKRFDNIIVDRLCGRWKMLSKSGEQKIFHPRDVIDILELCFYWFENHQDPPVSYSMDNLREYFGMSSENAHDALKDIRDSSVIIQKFMRLHRHFTNRVRFRGAMCGHK